MSSPQRITQLLMEWDSGNAAALEELLPLVERELADIAGRYLRDERRGHTLQTRDLVNEAWVKLFGQRQARWHNRAHFFGVAAILMRRILIDYAKSHGRIKRGGGGPKVSLSEVPLMSREKAARMVELNEALKRLEKLDERKSQIVLLKYFAGLSIKEIADALGLAPSTVSLEWKFAKAWLRDEMGDGK